MTVKEKFLENLKAKIKQYQDAYEYNRGLPDDLFEALNGQTLKVVDKIVIPRNGAKISTEYGANINALRSIIQASGTKGISKGDMVDKFPDVEGDKYSVVTNALTSLKKGKEVEGIKPRGVKMKGFNWRMIEQG